MKNYEEGMAVADAGKTRDLLSKNIHRRDAEFAEFGEF
jgi:hypothetical protein